MAKQSDPVREMFDARIRLLDTDIKYGREVVANSEQAMVSLQKQAVEARQSVEDKVAERRTIIDAMQKVCNVSAVPPEEPDADGMTEGLREVERFGSPAALAIVEADKAANMKFKDAFLSPSPGCCTEEPEKGPKLKAIPYKSVTKEGSEYFGSKLPEWGPTSELIYGVDYELVKVTGNPSESGPCSLSELGISNPARQPQKDFVVRFKCGCCARYERGEADYVTEKCRMENGCYFGMTGAAEAYENRNEPNCSRGTIDPNIISAKWESPK